MSRSHNCCVISNFLSSRVFHSSKQLIISNNIQGYNMYSIVTSLDTFLPRSAARIIMNVIAVFRSHSVEISKLKSCHQNFT